MTTTPVSPSFSQSSSPPPTPAPPVPESDPQLGVAFEQSAEVCVSSKLPLDEHDIFKIPAVEALKMLVASIELLVEMTHDFPPTPPAIAQMHSQMSDLQFEKEKIVRSHSERSLTRLQQAAQESGDRQDSQAGRAEDSSTLLEQVATNATQRAEAWTSHATQEIDGVRLRRRPPAELQPYIVVGADSQPLNVQHSAITRKFFCKKEPPISIGEYLVRLHQFCPMSTAVYLAASLYLHRMAVEEQIIAVTRRNAHRLVLAGLRVAMKALEDMSYSHAKIAKVGGVSKPELARLEISFCFLAGFELVGEDSLSQHWDALRRGQARQMLMTLELPKLKLSQRARDGMQA